MINECLEGYSFWPEPRKAGSRSFIETDILEFTKNCCPILLEKEEQRNAAIGNQEHTSIIITNIQIFP
jgi:hypothetical protein